MVFGGDPHRFRGPGLHHGVERVEGLFGERAGSEASSSDYRSRGRDRMRPAHVSLNFAITSLRSSLQLRWRICRLTRTWSVRVAVAALAAMMGLAGMAAQGQVKSPPPNPQLPPPAPLAEVRYNFPWEIYGGFAYSHFDAGPNLLPGREPGRLRRPGHPRVQPPLGRRRERARLLRHQRHHPQLRRAAPGPAPTPDRSPDRLSASTCSWGARSSARSATNTRP